MYIMQGPAGTKSIAESLGEETYMKGLPQRDTEALRDQPQWELLLRLKMLGKNVNA